MKTKKSIANDLPPVIALIIVLLLASLQIPVANAFWRDVLGASGEVTIQLPTPTTTATPTLPPDQHCQVTGTLMVTPFFENGKFGIDIELCLKNNGSSRVEFLQILSIIQARTESNDFIDHSTSYFDLGEKPYLDPSEQYCYSAHIVFEPGNLFHYRNKITVSMQLAPSQNKLMRSMSDLATEPDTLDLFVEFSLPEILEPNVTQTAEMIPTNLPLSEETITPAETLISPPPETLVPTDEPIPPTEEPIPLPEITEEVAPTEEPAPAIEDTPIPPEATEPPAPTE